MKALFKLDPAVYADTLHAWHKHLATYAHTVHARYKHLAVHTQCVHIRQHTALKELSNEPKNSQIG